MNPISEIKCAEYSFCAISNFQFGTFTNITEYLHVMAFQFGTQFDIYKYLI